MKTESSDLDDYEDERTAKAVKARIVTTKALLQRTKQNLEADERWLADLETRLGRKVYIDGDTRYNVEGGYYEKYSSWTETWDKV